VENRNQADSLVYSAEQMVKDNGDKIPEDLKPDLDAKITALKAAIAANSTAEMQTGMTELNNAMQQVGQAVYSQTAGDPGQPPTDGADDIDPGDSESSGDDEGGSTVEGEFREV
jgi:molecular chaperone DnaK